MDSETNPVCYSIPFNITKKVIFPCYFCLLDSLHAMQSCYLSQKLDFMYAIALILSGLLMRRIWIRNQFQFAYSIPFNTTKKVIFPCYFCHLGSIFTKVGNTFPVQEDDGGWNISLLGRANKLQAFASLVPSSLIF